MTNLKRLCGKKYHVTYDDNHPGRGPEFYILPGEEGCLFPHHNEGSLLVACHSQHWPGMAMLQEIGIRLSARKGRTYFVIDSADWKIAAEAIIAYERAMVNWKRK